MLDFCICAIVLWYCLAFTLHFKVTFPCPLCLWLLYICQLGMLEVHCFSLVNLGKFMEITFWARSSPTYFDGTQLFCFKTFWGNSIYSHDACLHLWSRCVTLIFVWCRACPATSLMGTVWREMQQPTWGTRWYFCANEAPRWLVMPSLYLTCS